MIETSKLKLNCLAIGSLPYTNLDETLQVIEQNFGEIPFWAQLPKLNKNEDMIFQFLENMPSFFFDKNSEKIFLETESEKFFQDIEDFYLDYENIISDINCDAIEKYAINNSAVFPKFISLLKKTEPQFAKGQIVGPFTLATTLVDKSGRCAYYDETLREIIVKTLSIKALWQIKHIKKVKKDICPIIFIDEPSISQLGTSAFITIPSEDVISMIKEISDLIKINGGVSAIHCCGKCDWTVPINAGVNIINLDAFDYAKNLSFFNKEIKEFLYNGNKIAWGVIPTLNPEILKNITLNDALQTFEQAVKYLTAKGIDEKIIIENSLITPSCGAGSLSKDLALKAMELTKELSDTLKERYKI